MNWDSVFLWGLLATGLLTTLMRAAEGLGYTRMDVPFMLGTIFTSNRDSAKVIGSVVHFINGWLFRCSMSLSSKGSGSPPGGWERSWGSRTGPSS